MSNLWFRWEREASLHLLFPTLEVFYEPLKKYSGVSAPTMILIFKNGIVTWCIEEKEFIEYCRKLLEIYIDSSKENKMVRDIKKDLAFLKQTEKLVEKTELEDVNNQRLVELHSQLYQAFLNYYTMGAIGTPLSYVAEIELKETGLTDEQNNQLSTPNEISYISEAENYLFETEDIDGFIQKYYWIDNNYLATKVLSISDIKKRLESLKSKNQNTHDRDSFALDLKLNKKQLRLIELIKSYSMYKDDRKKEILIHLHFMGSLLKEVSRRTGVNIEQIRMSLPSEFEDVLSGELTIETLQIRLNYCVIVWEEDLKVPLVLTGEEAKIWEQKTLETLLPNELLRGRIACKGIVRGRVRVLPKAEDSGEMKEGEVLVDFMPAIRKASAIVTNLGGVTSHAAIISRELIIPCIVGTKIATQVLKTGDLVEVDADKGVVRL